MASLPIANTKEYQNPEQGAIPAGLHRCACCRFDLTWMVASCRPAPNVNYQQVVEKSRPKGFH